MTAQIPDIYNSGDFDKCLNACNKAIDKKKDLKVAYLYKAKVYAHRATQTKGCGDCIIRSLNSLITLRYKDIDEVFKKEHSLDFDTIYKVAVQTGLYLLNDNSRTVNTISQNLLKLEKKPMHIYLSGKLAMQNNELFEGTKLYNESAKLVHEEFKLYGETDLSHLVIFSDLADALVEFNDLNSAVEIYNRAMTFFGMAADSLYVKFLYSNAFYGPYSFYNDSIADIFFQATDQIEEKNRVDISDLRTEIILHYLEEESSSVKSIVNKYVCETYKYTQHLTIDFLLQSTLNSIEWELNELKVEAVYNQDLLDGLLSLGNCTGVSIPDLIVRLKNDEELIDAAKLFSAIESSGLINDKDFELGRQIQGEVVDYLKTNGYSEEYYQAFLVLPGSEDYKEDLLDVAIVEIATLINKGEFSKAGKWLKIEYAQNPTSKELNELYRTWVTKDFLLNYKGSNMFGDDMKWTGNSNTCIPGTVDSIVYVKFIQRLNYVRRLAGVPDSCQLDTKWNTICQQTALMMDAENDLDHHPGNTFACYTQEGARGAGVSNLSLGHGGVSALMGQVADYGFGNTSVGHRRWILNPNRRVFGMGTTPNAMALAVFGISESNYPREEIDSDNPVMWPSANYFPEELMVSRWSFSLSGANFEDASVSLTGPRGKMNLKQYAQDNGYGLNTLVWDVEGLSDSGEKEQRYLVIIDGVKHNGETKTYAYPVIFLSIEE